MINHTEIINVINENSNISKSTIRIILRQFMKVICDNLENGEDVKTTLGIFTKKYLKNMQITDFKNGSRKKLSPRYRVHLKPSATLHNSLSKINDKLQKEEKN